MHLKVFPEFATDQKKTPALANQLFHPAKISLLQAMQENSVTKLISLVFAHERGPRLFKLVVHMSMKKRKGNCQCYGGWEVTLNCIDIQKSISLIIHIKSVTKY